MKTVKIGQVEHVTRSLIHRLRYGTSAQRGFTLIELLVVIIIIAVLASIAIPTFMSQRQRAQDTAAYTLVRNALTAIQGAFVDTGDYRDITVDQLTRMEPSIAFVNGDEALVTTSPAWINQDVPAQARHNEVAFYAEGQGLIDIASLSESGNLFGIQLNTVNITDTGYVKVKVVEEKASLGW
jgi:prepilin-type N-terminal cleavage/methylation domain-containing protein